MASIKYKDNGTYKDIVVKVGDTLPIGTEVDYEGSSVPNGWEEVSDPNEYSTTEQVVGTYLGKPLYRKIISVLVSANTTSDTALSSEGINNPDIIIINTGKSVSHYNINIVGGAYNNPNYYSSTTDYGNIYVDGNKVMHIVNISSVQRQYYICLEYTKTTD